MQAALTLDTQLDVPRAEVPRSTAAVLNLDSARQRKLVAQYGPLVERQVQRAVAKVGFCLDVEELRSAAYLGLLEAGRRYDSTREIPFEVFAQHRIQGAILDELRARDHLRRLSRQRSRTVRVAHDRLISRLGREPTESELARSVGEDLETFRTRGARERAQAKVSIEDLAAADWDIGLRWAEPSLLDRLCEHELRSALVAVLNELPERLRNVVTWYYRDERSYREIGQSLGVSESRVCQIVKGLQHTLRERLAPFAA